MGKERFLTAMSASFDQMRAAKELVDIVLVFGDLKLSCHKLVLASTSEYFRRMFQAGHKESQSEEIVMKKIDDKTGILLVEYFYSGEININSENALCLLSASNMLLLDDLKGEVENFLCSHIGPQNCVAFLNMSHLHDLQDLIKEYREYITEEWKNIDEAAKNQLREEDMVAILCNCEVQEENFLYLVDWVETDKRKVYKFMDLMVNVHLPACSKEFINNTVLGQKLMQNPKGIKLIQQALNTIYQRKHVVTVVGL
ncbi:hypothetical protein CAPTEDRAFT_128104 [Capitella teleta]|uniref:BTB domain-containing protein n=1 Tax=Capitella teleta TaxID=283909 RepID=R7TM83_CAPTE|nr:hypothetical protein CAPTEDRAFT_128104 [Capitella teleta]|eukprot:ELT94647.1 hypothetical protein CAPTEDRAFT_128104 [Capitella teleta]